MRRGARTPPAPSSYWWRAVSITLACGRGLRILACWNAHLVSTIIVCRNWSTLGPHSVEALNHQHVLPARWGRKVSRQPDKTTDRLRGSRFLAATACQTLAERKSPRRLMPSSATQMVTAALEGQR